MKFGLCCSLENASLALTAGFDYVELGASQLRGDDPDFSENPFVGIPTPATNVFFRPGLQMLGLARTPVTDYIQRTVERAAQAGVRTMVIGSGGFRRAPEGVDPASALETFLRLAEFAQHVGRPLGVTVAPESLNHLETNVGNDLAELAIALRSVGVAYCLDTYHVLVEHEGREVDWTEQIPFAPAHVHLGNRPRNVPSADDPHLRAAAARLHELGYQGLVSYEGSIKLEEFDETLSAMRHLFVQNG